MTKTEKFYKSKKLVGTSVTINEKLIPDKARMLLAIETDGVLVPKFERIYIANVQFVKQERGEWKKFDSSEKESGGGFRAESPVFVRKVETKDISQYMVIDSSVENKPAKLYYYLRCSLIGTVMYIFEQRTWIDENGKIIKETESQRNTTPDNITQLGTTNYEYDPKNLKIEAPIK